MNIIGGNQKMRSDLMKKGLERAPHRSLLKAIGYTNEEIAQELGVVQRTIERKLGLIRNTWMPDLADGSTA